MNFSNKSLDDLHMMWHEVRDQIEDLECEALKLEQEIDRVQNQSRLFRPSPGSGVKYYSIGVGIYNQLTARANAATSSCPEDYETSNIFQTFELANNYAKAIETLLELRHQPGVARANEEGTTQYIIIPPGEQDKVRTCECECTATKLAVISPQFESVESAENAIKAIGENRLMHMFKTLHQIEDWCDNLH